MSSTLIQALQYIFVAVLVLVGQVVVARLSKKAQEAPVQVDSQTEATKAWQEYAQEMKDAAKEMRERLGSVEARLSETEAREAENRRRIAALERQGERDKDLIRRLLTRLRRAIDEIKRLGGTVPDVDNDLTDLAQLRLDISDERDDIRLSQ